MSPKKAKELKHEKDDIQSSETTIYDSKSFILDWDNSIRIIGSVVGAASIIAALLYFFGYFEFAGILAAMNIPTEIVIPNELYLLMGVGNTITFIFNVFIMFLNIYLFAPLVNYIVKSITNRITNPYVIFTLCTVLSVSLLLIGARIALSATPTTIGNFIVIPSFFIFAVIEILSVMGKAITNLSIFSRSNQVEDIRIQDYLLGSIKFFVLTGGIIALLFLQRSTAIGDGRAKGCKRLVETPTSAVLFSNNPIALDGEVQKDNLYIYKDYYLLISDNNNYYLFKEVDPQKLEPKSVFIIKKDAIQTIELESVKTPSKWNITNSCPGV